MVMRERRYGKVAGMGRNGVVGNAVALLLI
jgi:hypothetical protein